MQDLFLDEAWPHGGLGLRHWPPKIEELRPRWRTLVSSFLDSSEGQALVQAIQARLEDGVVIYPPKPLRLLEMLEPHEVRVVILGQDPYHGPGQAEGLAFSVANGIKAPPSLVNMFKELRRDEACVMPPPMRSSLLPWVKQGVFLLNQTLSVEQSCAASHARLPWSMLTQRVLQAICSSPEPTVFLLWGIHAQKSRTEIERWSLEAGKDILLLSANHPSPLSALKGEHPFIGCGHFGQAKKWLAQRGVALDWQLSGPFVG